jgi:uncharacterized membrane protein
MNQSLHSQPTTGPQLVLGTFDDQAHAGAAVQALRQHGVADERISLVVRHDTQEVSAEEMAAIDHEAQSTGTDVAVGSMAGGLAGFVAGLALFSIPGLGPFLGICVLASTLGGAALGSAVGERAAHLTELGIPHERAERYQTAIESGYVVVAIVAPDPAAAQLTAEVLTRNGADEIDVHPYTGDETIT